MASGLANGMSRASSSIFGEESKQKPWDASKQSAKMSGHVSKHLMDGIEAAFKEIDDQSDQSGTLDKRELQRLWRQVFTDMTDNEVLKISDDLYQDLDPNGDGQVSWPEIEEYFLGSGKAKTAVDKMLEDNIEWRAPNCREKMWALVDPDSPSYELAPEWLGKTRVWSLTLSNATIGVSIMNFVIESLPSRYAQQGSTTSTSFYVEAVCIAIFTVEFFVRFIFCPSQKNFWTSGFTWVDVCAILPFYVGVSFGDTPAGALVVLRVLRLLRLFRMLKLGKRFEAVQVLCIALFRTAYPLMVSMLGVNSIAVVLFASLITTVEKHQATFDDGLQKWVRNPDSDYDDAGKEIMFQSVPDAMWWAWVTLTTVGFGDQYPVSAPGRAIASVTMCCGLVLMCFPLTMLAGAFADAMHELRRKKQQKNRGQDLRQWLLRSSFAQVTKGGFFAGRPGRKECPKESQEQDLAASGTPDRRPAAGVSRECAGKATVEEVPVLSEPPPLPEPAPMPAGQLCDACDSELLPDAFFCRKCAHPTRRTASRLPPKKPPPPPVRSQAFGGGDALEKRKSTRRRWSQLARALDVDPPRASSPPQRSERDDWREHLVEQLAQQVPQVAAAVARQDSAIADLTLQLRAVAAAVARVSDQQQDGGGRRVSVGDAVDAPGAGTSPVAMV